MHLFNFVWCSKCIFDLLEMLIDVDSKFVIEGLLAMLGCLRAVSNLKHLLLGIGLDDVWKSGNATQSCCTI